MKENENTISPDRENKLAETFEHINLLLNNEAIHEAKINLLQLHYADLADFLDNTNHKLYSTILPAILDNIEPEMLVSLSDSSRQPVLENIGMVKSGALVSKLDIEDAIEVVDSLDDNCKKFLLDNVDTKIKHQILEGFYYPENTVGRIVEKDFIAFQKHWTVGQAIDYIRRSKIDYDFHAAIIVDSRFKPVGNILLSTLLKSSRSEALSSLINSEFRVADTFTEIDDLVYIFKQYALTIVAVVNKSGKLVGTVSIDNMIYIIEEQTESEFMQLGGIKTSDIFNNLVATSKHRFPWLFVNLVTACITSMIIDEFSESINQLITLAVIMPIVAALSGNVGTQVMTVTVRAIASREINSSNSKKIILKEILVATINGIFIAVIGAFMTYILFNQVDISIVFACAVFLNFAIAGLLGSCIPLILNSLNLDPATASGVFVTTFTDAFAFLGFLGLATIFLL